MKKTVNAQNEFFLAICKQDVHSFIMMGVLDNQGHPKVLARVGKTNMVDKSYENGCALLGKVIIGTSLAVVTDEPIESSSDEPKPISYQAYSINFDQVKGFLSLILAIENKQAENPEINEGLTQLGWGKMDCYIPTTADEKQITFERKFLHQWKIERQYHNIDKVARSAQNLSLTNTCRTTALQIIENVIGYKTGVSSNFIFAPRYHTTLIKAQPCPDTFYILPPPPTAFDQLPTEQLNIARKLYKRLENIPKSKHSDPKTRVKFENLKKLYTDITGQNNLDVSALLEKIMEHEKTNGAALYTVRSPNFFSRKLGLKSTTERLLTTIKSELQHHIDRAPTAVL